jgi:hypothetical protein
MRALFLPICLLCASGCFGKSEVGMSTDPASLPPGLPTDAVPVDHPQVVVQPPPVDHTVTAAFTLPRERVSLIPFQVRLTKLAAVLGVSAADPLLAGIRANRLDLGDSDFANGVRPDRGWTAAKIALWVRELKPVCASATMKARFTLPKDLEALVPVAYGRRAEPADRQLLEEAIAGITLTDVEKHDAACLAILSSAEFVSR